jgi:hypothetical protein
MSDVLSKQPFFEVSDKVEHGRDDTLAQRQLRQVRVSPATAVTTPTQSKAA